MNSVQQEIENNKKVGNLGEHIRVLTEEVVMREAQNNELLQEKQELLSELNKIDTEIHEKVNHQLELAKELQDWENALNKREIDILKREHISSEDTQAQEKDIIEKRARLAAKEAESIARLGKVQESINSLNERYNVVKHSIITSLDELSNSNKECVELIARIDGYKDIAKVLESTIEERKKDIESVELQISKQVELNNAEAGKIAELYKAVEEREEALAVKERNYKILKGRLGKVFKLLYPDQSIDNII